MNKIIRKRYISEKKLSREQALWLCRAVWTHYRTDATASDELRDDFDIFNRVQQSAKYKRGRDWAVHAIGYDLKEAWYGSESSGFREAWAALVALPINQGYVAPQEHRTYTAFGLNQGNELTIACYRVTEVSAASPDEGYLNYVFQCFQRLQDDAQEVPQYDPRGKHNKRR